MARSSSPAKNSWAPPWNAAHATGSATCPRDVRSSHSSPWRRTCAWGFGALPRAERAVPDRVYDLFPVLYDMRGRRGGDLSGGLQQQLAIGRALVLRPRLLILDEPTEGIQPNVVRQIGDVILDLNQSDGLTVLIVEQKLPFAQRVADRFCIMSRGRSVAAGVMEDLDETLVQEHLSV